MAFYQLRSVLQIANVENINIKKSVENLIAAGSFISNVVTDFNCESRRAFAMEQFKFFT